MTRLGWTLLILMVCQRSAPSVAAEPRTVDVVVYGATASGVVPSPSAAVATASTMRSDVAERSPSMNACHCGEAPRDSVGVL